MTRSLAAIWSDRLGRVTAYLAVAGGVALVMITAIVTAGVVMRYGFNQPLLGINEFVQLTAIALIMSALPYCTHRQDHVAVDVFEPWIGKWGRFAGDVASPLLAGFVFSILSHRAALKALDAWEWGDATNMIRLPIWPFYAVLAVGAGLCVLVFAVQFVAILSRGVEQ